MAARITLGISALLLLIAVWLCYAFRARYILFGEKAIGTVMALNDDGSTFSPVVSYTTASGAARQYEGLGSSDAAYYVGERVAMRYFEADPTAARISSSFHELWLPALVVGIVGAIFGLVGMIMRRVEG